MVEGLNTPQFKATSVAGSAAVEQPPSVLGEATNRMRTCMKRLSVAIREHGRRMDMLVGPVPEDPSTPQEVPTEQSELSKLFGALDDLEQMVNAVETEMSRLQGLAG